MKKTLIGLAILNLAMANAMGKGLMPQMEEPYAKSGWVVGVDAGYGFLGTNESGLYSLPNWTFEAIPGGITMSHVAINQYDHETSKTGRFVWGANMGYDFAISNKTTMGFEVGYKDLGKSKYHSDYEFVAVPDSIQTSAYIDATEVDWHREIKQQAVDFLLTGHYYVYEGFNVFGKLGVALVNSKTSQHKFTTWEHSTWDSQSQEYTTHMVLGVPDKYENSIWRMRPELVLGMGYAINNNFDIHVSYEYIYGANEDGRYYDASMLQGVTAVAPLDLYMIPVNVAYSPAKIYSSNAVKLGLSFKF